MASNALRKPGVSLRRCAQNALKASIQARCSSSSTSHLHKELTNRQFPLLYDYLTFSQSHLLENTLSDFLPPYPKGLGIPSPPEWRTSSAQVLRPGYHLIYFPPPSRLSQLLPDNTEPGQSPGEPFVRRMWAGGSIWFMPSGKNPAMMGTGRTSVCMERISDVQIRGSEGDEKVFVTIERRIGNERLVKMKSGSWKWIDAAAGLPELSARKSLMDEKNCGTIEHRNIVFMRERNAEQAAAAAAAPSRVVKAPHKPSFSHSFTPTASLLFRFSALTWNAHSIHLDKQFCRDVEGHRNLLFHGPLSLVMMSELLQRHLASRGIVQMSGRYPLASRAVSEIEYRNMAPLYAEEEVQVCGREKENGAFDLWIENKDGGMCVKATAQTVEWPEKYGLKLKSEVLGHVVSSEESG